MSRTPSQKGRYSRRKGAAGEREAARVMTEHTGLIWERSIGQRRRGGSEMPDIMCDAVPEVHVEVKRGGRVSIPAAMRQAEADAAARGAIPVALTRVDQERPGVPAPPWMVTVRLGDLMALVRALGGGG